VDPVEVETALQSHPAVERAAVVAIPDQRLGHVGYAWVKLRDGAQCTPAQLIDFASPTMARFKLPRRIFVVEALPTTASGKVQKFHLAEELRKSQVHSETSSALGKA